MDHDTTLRQQALEAIQTGRMPARSPARFWGGPGEGACCAICCKTLRPEEVELEIEFGPTEDDSASRSYYAHTRCFAAWDCERQHFILPLSSAEGSIAARERPTHIERESV